MDRIRNIHCTVTAATATTLTETLLFRDTSPLMDIRFVSSLTPDDENELAPALLSAVAALLDRVEFAYTLRIETTGAKVLQHSHPAMGHRQIARHQPVV